MKSNNCTFASSVTAMSAEKSAPFSRQPIGVASLNCEFSTTTMLRSEIVSFYYSNLEYN